jgi:RNA polymerase-binding protein DksA
MAMAVRRGKRAGRSEGFQTAKKVKGKKAKHNPLHEVPRAAEPAVRGTRVAVPRLGRKIVESAFAFPPADAEAAHGGRLPLGPDELDELRALLEARRKAALKLVRRVTADEAEVEEDRRNRADPADRGADRAMEMLLLREQAKELAEIDEVDAALRRLRAGRYGICAACGGRIAFRRLLALPEARRCIRCENESPRPPRRG